MPSGRVTQARLGASMELALDRPAQRNALSEAMYHDLIDGLASAAADDGVGAVLLRAEGPHFTAGNDIGDFARQVADRGDPRDAMRFIEAVARFPKPLLAAVRGHCVGVGTTLLLHCDVVVVASDSRLSAPFCRLGLTPEAASSLLMPAVVGPKLAFRLFVLGDVVSGEEAMAAGLATCVADDVDGVARGFAERVAAIPRQAALATKALLRPSAAIEERLAVERDVFAQRLASEEARSAFAAFFEPPAGGIAAG